MRNRLVACTAMSRPTLPLLQKFVERLTRCPVFLRSAEGTLTRLQAAFTIFNREVSLMITRRHFSTLTLSIVAFMVLGPFVRAASPTRIDLSTVLPDGNCHTQNAKIYSEEVAKATGGEVQIQIHSGESLGFKGPDHLQAVGDGLVGMADIHISQQAGNEPVLAAETIPFLVNDMRELEILQDRKSTRLNSSH